MNKAEFELYNPGINLAYRGERYFGGDKGFIFIVPEIWGNRIFLNNEYNLIADIKQRFNVRHYFCEGAFYEMSTQHVKKFLNKPQKEVSSMFAAGQLKAQEYLASQSNDEIMIYGADNETLYNDQNSSYLAAREIYQSMQPFFKAVNTIIADIIKKNYSSDVINIYREIIQNTNHESFDQEITSFVHSLLKFAESHKIDIVLDQRIKKFFFMGNKQKPVDKTELLKLTNELDTIFSSDDPDDDLAVRVFSLPAFRENVPVEEILNRGYDELFQLYKETSAELKNIINYVVGILINDPVNAGAIEKLLAVVSIAGIDKNNYRGLFEYFDFWMEYEKTIKGSYHILGGYVNEVLVDQLLNRLTDRGLLKRLYMFEHDMCNLDRLFKTELIPEQARKIPYLMNKYSVETIIEFLDDAGADPKSTASLSEYSFFWDQTVARTKRFYDNAFKRSQYMLDNCIQNLEKNKADAAVLMAGGFHTQPVVRSLLRRGDYSFMVLQCQVGKINLKEGRAGYDGLMDKMNR